ncbi:AfsR/SARP family transcriptional regulator [Dactylosporangium sp. AC04546]|uniref:AfsR/SARP family transcriptional regulator n=1 Tax=Dactylosporangium sp. AC04546 TaxID=2862460 RepID=UPI001EDFD0BE|nr:AfsR/SARP family transcriptional regulator [Dactylosporangium sp. AC04546]WVK79061.1 AfsR/SARP family transcriptional regulator [Dactylosporangium sp. AC04546]
MGPLHVHNGTATFNLTAPKPRKVLALLLADANRPVQTSTLVEELWGLEPPTSAVTTLQTYIFQIRKALAKTFGRDRAQSILNTKPLSYSIAVDEQHLDILLFRRLAADGRAAMERGEHELASARLCRALDLWRGPAFADVATGPVLNVHAVELEERRLTAMEWRLEVDLHVGRHREVVGELTGLTAMHPMHEGLHVLLMVALAVSGRRSEALDVYQRLRSTLITQLGLEPSWMLRQTQQAILQSDSGTPIDVRDLLEQRESGASRRIA